MKILLQRYGQDQKLPHMYSQQWGDFSTYYGLNHEPSNSYWPVMLWAGFLEMGHMSLDLE